ncbi:MAG: CRISPR-associated endonuclease Cas2 [Rhodoferax sp.]|nr:CRISPR-associated endonuclease Cas2 [Rhodoferax sp.]
MSRHDTQNWLLCYDIADPRRLMRVHRLIMKEGIPLQYSVFWVQANRVRMGAIMAQLTRIIEKREDDVRAYPVPKSTWNVSVGNCMLPADVLIGGTLLTSSTLGQ